ncbi:sulfotransferase [Shewanella japonica]|uniref:sulfotransferase n=1 Tax=Shewanella japonica TaxID=93973 RepID=UPI0024956F94|nr:sulfotransferase [Shewanella japonica]
MYSFYIDDEIHDGVVVNTALIGTMSEPSLNIAGRIVSSGQVKSINVYNFIEKELLHVDTKITVAKNLMQQLALTDDLNPYRFEIKLSHAAIEDDLHFVIEAEIEMINGDVVIETIATGFIQPVTLPEKVVFVVGSPRSGTSALGKACRKSLKANAHGESHVVQGVNLLMEAADKFFQQSVTASVKGNFVNSIPRTLMLAEQLNVLRRLYRLYYGQVVHLDKTPGIPMLEGLPLALIAWPNAKVIFCKRRGMENIQSRLTKFPKVKFEQHIKQWKQSFIIWRKSKQKINKMLKNNQWFIEVDQHHMANSPALVADDVATLINLHLPQRNILLKQLASDDKPEQTSKVSYQCKHINDFGWSEAEVLQFRHICSNEMKLQNYSFDEQYFLDKQCVQESN